MRKKLESILISQLDEILSLYTDLAKRATNDDLSGLPEHEHYKLVVMSRAAIRRIAGLSSEYMKQLDEIADREKHRFIGARLTAIIGVVRSLRADLSGGHLQTLAELLHAEVFSDFLEMADYLLTEGYKDPAAIIAGAALEAHLRRLAELHGISLAARDRPKKADQLNADLAGLEIYSKLDQKGVTAWLDLRNKAAHGKFADYTREQVALLLEGIRDFMLRCPA